MGNKKIIMLIVLNMMFIFLLEITTIFLNNFILEIIILIAPLILASILNIQYIKVNNQINIERFFIILFFISITFELSKFILYSTGHLPRYTDTPILIGFILSIVVVSIYLLILISIHNIVVFFKNRNS